VLALAQNMNNLFNSPKNFEIFEDPVPGTSPSVGNAAAKNKKKKARAAAKKKKNQSTEAVLPPGHKITYYLQATEPCACAPTANHPIARLPPAVENAGFLSLAISQHPQPLDSAATGSAAPAAVAAPAAAAPTPPHEQGLEYGVLGINVVANNIAAPPPTTPNKKGTRSKWIVQVRCVLLLLESMVHAHGCISSADFPRERPRRRTPL
jgi:hypothetical protein